MILQEKKKVFCLEAELNGQKAPKKKTQNTLQIQKEKKPKAKLLNKQKNKKKTSEGNIEKDRTNVLTYVNNFYGKLYKKNNTNSQTKSFN